MYKNNGSFIPDIDKNIKSTKRMKRKPNRNIIINPKLKRALCFLTGCIHIVIFILIYVYGIYDLYIGIDIDETIAYMVLGIGFLVAGIFCFRHFKLQDRDKVNIVTFNIGVLLVAFFAATMVGIWMDEWINHLNEIDEDVDGSIVCIIGIVLGVFVTIGGLKGDRAKEVLDSLEKHDAIDDERRSSLKNYADILRDDSGWEKNDKENDEEADNDVTDGEKDKDEYTISDKEKNIDKHESERNVIYNTLINNKPNDNNFY